MLSLRNNWAFLSLLSVIILLPWAGEKIVFFGLPLYLPELAILLASFFFFRKLGQRLLVPDGFILFGLLLFCGGALLSFFFNPLSLTGLGMLKSWFFFPVLLGWFLWQTLRVTKEYDLVLSTWLLVLLGIAVRSLSFLFAGDLTYDGRLAGDYTSPNFLAIIMAPAPLLIAYFFLAPTTLRQDSWWRIIFLSISFPAVLFVLFATHSYGVWLGLALAFTLLFFGYGWTRFSWKGWAAGSLLTLGFLASLVFVEHNNEKWQALFTLDQRSSLTSREMIWQVATLIIRERPLFGIGVGRFQEKYLAYQQHFPPYLEWAVPEPHNIFLAVFLATGLLGIFGFLLVLGRTLFFLVEQYHASGTETEQRLILLLLSLWTVFLMYGLFDTPYFKNDLSLLFFLLLALSLSGTTQKKTSLSVEVSSLGNDYNSIR
ncbi:MAG: O-antigen ligase family protein [Candidatus Moranbacteria bacterium]|nr:O-antigen ligase family protein [Candidatus Moranbacteria bacterium]